MSVLRELFLGEVLLETSPKSEEYDNIYNQITVKEEEIRKLIKDDKIKELFDELSELQNSLLIEEEFSRFKQGFALGLNLKEESKEILDEIKDISFK